MNAGCYRLDLGLPHGATASWASSAMQVVAGKPGIMHRKKARRAPGLVSSAQWGKLLLLLRLLIVLLLAITLILLRGGVALALAGGLRGFILNLLFIGHSISFKEDLKSIFQVLLQYSVFPGKYNNFRFFIFVCKEIQSKQWAGTSAQSSSWRCRMQDLPTARSTRSIMRTR
jgi:hypothetical protein